MSKLAHCKEVNNYNIIFVFSLYLIFWDFDGALAPFINKLPLITTNHTIKPNDIICLWCLMISSYLEIVGDIITVTMEMSCI